MKPQVLLIVTLVPCFFALMLCFIIIIISRYHVFGFYSSHKYMSRSEHLPIIKNATVYQINRLLDPTDLCRTDKYPDSLLESASQMRHTQRMGIPLSHEFTRIHAGCIIIEGTVYQLSFIEFYKFHFWYTKFLKSFPIVKYNTPWDELRADLNE